MAVPKVVICGRPNVGKSSLLNVLARRRVSIVDPTAGVTRDRISIDVELPADSEGMGEGRAIELIDTGGFGVVDQQQLEGHVERQIASGLDEADVLLFVVDAQAELSNLDIESAELIRRLAGPKRKPVLLIANKVDAEKYEADAWDSMTLGLGEPIMTSATTGHNRLALIDALHRALDRLPDLDDEPANSSADPALMVAIVGKRNAGKSTLVNALVGEERVIASDVEGTTRDSVDVKLTWEDRRYTLIDTAGLRRGKSVKQDLEYYAQHRALRSIRRADVCLFLIDATLPISAVDKKLAQEILKHHRPTVLVVNKWDLVGKKASQEDYAEYLDKEMMGFSFAPIVFTSATDGQGLAEALAMADNLREQTLHRMGTGELNRFFEALAQERGPSGKGGRHAKIYYASQVSVDPPAIALFVNDPKLIDGNYERFILNRMRDELPFSEVPIKLLLRGKQKMTAAERVANKEM